MKDKNSLGRANLRQVSLEADVDQFSLEKKILNQINSINLSDDKYENEIYKSLIDFGKLHFEINKHEELFCSKVNDVNKLFQYLTFRYKFRLSGSQKVLFDLPQYLLLEPVSTCNLRCPFCFQTDKSFTKKPYMGVMKFDLFKKVIDEADEHKVGAITLASRGEPTLHKQLGEMLKYAASKQNIFEIKLNTNGTFLTEKLIHTILKANITQIVISADHYEKINYERLRKGSNFEKILQNVDKLYSIRNTEYQNSLTEIRVSGVDADRNIDKKKFRDFWIQRSDHVSIGPPLERWDTYKNNVHEHITDPCERLWDRMYIWFDGKVNPCDADYKSYLSYGDASKDTLKSIWSSQKIQMLRDDHIKKNRCKANPCDRCGVSFV